MKECLTEKIIIIKNPTASNTLVKICKRRGGIKFNVGMGKIHQCCCDTKTVLVLSVKYRKLLPEECPVKLQSGLPAILISAAL